MCNDPVLYPTLRTLLLSRYCWCVGEMEVLSESRPFRVISWLLGSILYIVEYRRVASACSRSLREEMECVIDGNRQISIAEQTEISVSSLDIRFLPSFQLSGGLQKFGLVIFRWTNV